MNDKNFKVIMTVAIVAIIAVIGIGFAAFSTELKINFTGLRAGEKLKEELRK